MKTDSYLSALLDFIYELPNDYRHYPDHVLELIDRYFPFHKLTFIPLNTSFSKLTTLTPDSWLNEVHTRGLTEEHLNQYYTRGVTLDPFRMQNLPVELKLKSVIHLKEAFPIANPQSIRYKTFLKDIDLPHQPIMNLVYDHIRLGVISVYRTEKEGDFQPEEIQLLEQLNRFITQHYLMALSQTNLHLAEKLFDSCFFDAAFGVLIMDSKQTIVKSNHCAHRYCRDLYRTLFHNANAALSESEKADLFIENHVINQFREQLLSSDDHIIVPANNQLYEFWISPFVSRDENFDKVILNYTLFIFRSSHVTSEDRLDYSNIKQKLTDREWEIAVLISQRLTNTAIAEKTFISLNTVKTHIQHIYEKLNIPNRVSLMRLLSKESKVQF